MCDLNGQNGIRDQTDAALLRQFRGGSQTAFNELHNRHDRCMRKYLHDRYRSLLSDEVIDDVLQDVWLSFVTDATAGLHSVPGWLREASRSRTKNHFRQLRRERERTERLTSVAVEVDYLPLEEVSETWPGPVEDGISYALAKTVCAAMQKLDKSARDMIDFVYFGGLTVFHASTRAGLSRQCGYEALKRAAKSLQPDLVGAG